MNYYGYLGLRRANNDGQGLADFGAAERDCPARPHRRVASRSPAQRDTPVCPRVARVPRSIPSSSRTSSVGSSNTMDSNCSSSCSRPPNIRAPPAPTCCCRGATHPQRNSLTPTAAGAVPRRSGIPAALGRAPPPASGVSFSPNMRQTTAFPGTPFRGICPAVEARRGSASRAPRSSMKTRIPTPCPVMAPRRSSSPSTRSVASRPNFGSTFVSSGASTSRRCPATASRGPLSTSRSSVVCAPITPRPVHPSLQEITTAAIVESVEESLSRQENDERDMMEQNLTDMQQFRRQFVFAALRENQNTVLANLGKVLQGSRNSPLMRPFAPPRDLGFEYPDSYLPVEDEEMPSFDDSSSFYSFYNSVDTTSSSAYKTAEESLCPSVIESGQGCGSPTLRPSGFNAMDESSNDGQEDCTAFNLMNYDDLASTSYDADYLNFQAGLSDCATSSRYLKD